MRSKYVLLGSLYVSQYLGIAFIFAAVPAILRASGTELADLAWIYGLGLIWALKFLWAPWVDRFGSKRHGHYRSWLLATQSLLIATLAGAAQLDLTRDPTLLAISFALIAALAATQDIAADALAVTLLGPEERGLGNSVQMGGGLIGNLLGGGVVLMAYPWLGWTGCMWLLAGATALPLVQVLRHREGTAPADLRRERAGHRDLVRFLQRPGNLRWVLVLSTFNVGIGLGYALLNPMLVDLGWSLDRIGFAVNVVGSLAGVAGAVLAGWLAQRAGRKHAMAITQILVALATAALFAPARGIGSSLVLYASISLMVLAWGASATIAATVMMDKSDPTRAGTDYTLQYSIASILSYVLGGAALGLAGAIGYAGALTVAIVASLAALAAIWLYDGFAPTMSARLDAGAVHGAGTSPAATSAR